MKMMEKHEKIMNTHWKQQKHRIQKRNEKTKQKNKKDNKQ